MTFPPSWRTYPLTITCRGGTTDTEGRPAAAATVVAVVDGMVNDLSATEVPQGGTLGEESTAEGILPLQTDVQTNDVVTFSRPDSGLTLSYRVVAVHYATRALLVDLRRDG